MTNTIDDITQRADTILLVGSNPEEAHPVLGMQIRAAVERGCKLIVVDPRDIKLAAQAEKLGVQMTLQRQDVFSYMYEV